MKLWKRALGLFLLLAVLVLVLPTNADAAVVASGTCGSKLTWVLNDAGTLTISGTGEMYNGCQWDDYCGTIKAVVIKNGVTSIGYAAFDCCRRLSSIEIPDSVTSIDGYAFYECISLTSIELPDSVTSIGEYAFAGCTSMTGIGIPGSVTSFGDSAFYDCTSLTSIEILDGVTGIGTYAFDGCESLTSIELPDSVTSIGYGAFMNCSSLTSIDIPASVTSIGEYAFYECTSLTSIEVESGNENYSSVDGVLFNKDKTKLIQAPGAIRTYSIPDSVTRIGDFSFYNCTSLTSIEILGSVTSIGEYAFAYCTSLTNIEIPDSVAIIDQNAFWQCDNLTSIEIPDSVTSIREGAFWHCDSLTSIYFQGDAPGFGNRVFANVTATAYYPAGNETWTQAVMQDYGGEITWVAYTAAPVVKASNVASTGKIKVSWNKVSGATKYMVYRSTSKNSGYSRLVTTDKNYVINKSIDAGEGYYYYVVAVAKDGTKSAKSNKVYRTCDLGQPEITLTNVASSGKIKVSWKAVEGATKYEVYRATSKNGTYKRITTTKNLYVTNTSAVAGKTYYYKVRAICGVDSAKSAFSAIGYRCCDLARPVVTLSRNSSGNPVIKWDAIKGAIKYEVWYATSKNGTYKRLITTKNTKVVNSSAVAGKTYYYKVRAICGVSSATSAYSTVKYIKAK